MSDTTPVDPGTCPVCPRKAGGEIFDRPVCSSRCSYAVAYYFAERYKEELDKKTSALHMVSAYAAGLKGNRDKLARDIGCMLEKLVDPELDD